MAELTPAWKASEVDRHAIKKLSLKMGWNEKWGFCCQRARWPISSNSQNIFPLLRNEEGERDRPWLVGFQHLPIFLFYQINDVLIDWPFPASLFSSFFEITVGKKMFNGAPDGIQTRDRSTNWATPCDSYLLDVLATLIISCKKD